MISKHKRLNIMSREKDENLQKKHFYYSFRLLINHTKLHKRTYFKIKTTVNT